MKGAIESLFALLGMKEGRYRLLPSANAAFNPMASADVYLGKDLVGTFGVLSPKVERSEPIVGELDLGYLLAQSGGRFRVEGRKNVIPVRRDLSFRLDGKADYATVRRTILKARDSHIVDVALFDLFHDDKDGADYLGVSLFIAGEKTFTDAEIAQCVDKAVAEVKKSLGLCLRGENNA